MYCTCNITKKQFDDAMEDLIDNMTAKDLMNIPELYKLFEYKFYNKILDLAHEMQYDANHGPEDEGY